MKRYLLLGLSLLFVAGLVGCGDKTDEDELREAENLVNGLNMMVLMTDVDQYTEYTIDNGLCAPPFGWTGPDSFDVPEGSQYLYYQWAWKIRLDSSGTTIDSLLWLVMLTPDYWADTANGLPTAVDIWLLGETRNQIFFHTILSINDSTSVSGSLKWNWEETYYQYEYDVSQQTEAAQIDITTSTNIGLGAHFLFDSLGAGTETDCYAEWNNTTFVRYSFFAEPDSANNDGYYKLLSEAWKIEHYFKLVN